MQLKRKEMGRESFILKAGVSLMATVSLLLFSLFGCRGQENNANRYASAGPVVIHRFDKELLQRLEQGDSIAKDSSFAGQYSLLLQLLEQSLFKAGGRDSAGSYARLASYYSEPHLHGLYREAVEKFADVSSIEKALGAAFAYLKAEWPALQVPAVYMHVSGLNQNVLVGDSLLSLSIDKYLGSAYPLYQEFFYDYQLRKMKPDYVAPDYLRAWLLSEFPFEGKETVLLERMIYEGKIIYLLQQALPETSPDVLFGYAPAESEWCTKNERALWRTILERKQLYTPDLLTTAKYFEEAPARFLSEDAPGNLGRWLGWRIVSLYMERTGAAPSALMANADAQDILAKSRYKP